MFNRHKIIPSGFVVLLCAILIIMMFSGCKQKKAAEEVENAMKLTDSEMLYSTLKDIAERYPHNLESRANLAVLSLVEGNLESANRWVSEALKEISPRSRSETVYLVYSTAADAALRSNNYKAAFDAANQALEKNNEDPLSSRLILARAAFKLEKYEVAAEAYDISFEKSSPLLMENDYKAYLQLLAQKEMWLQALNVGYEKFQRSGYSPGTGTVLSAFHEKLQEMALSILLAYLDLKYENFTGSIPDTTVTKNLQTLQQTLLDTGMMGDGEPVLSAISQMEEENWDAAYSLLTGISTDNPVMTYWKFVAAIESNTPLSPDFVARYMSLEDYFRTYPEYYYRAFHMFRKSGINSDFASQRPVLEKVILMAPQSQVSEECRTELCRLMSIDTARANDLYLLHEQEAALQQFAATHRTEVLTPIVKLLDWENNPYTYAAESTLRNLADIPAVREFLQSVQNTTQMRKKRIQLILEKYEKKQ